MRIIKGFTLVELMITIGVLAIIGVIASPSMFTLIEKQNFQKNERMLLTAVSTAKSQAVLRRTNVTLDLNSLEANTPTTVNWMKGSNQSLTIQSLGADLAVGTFSGTTLTFNANGIVSNLTQDALISICNSKLKVKKVLVITKLGSIYKKPEETC